MIASSTRVWPTLMPTMLVWALTAAVLAGPVAGQGLPADFYEHSGSSLRAGLLYLPFISRSTDGGNGMIRPGDASRPAPPDDLWLSFDKAEHATVGFLFTVGAQYVFVNKLGAGELDALPLSVGVASTAAIGKELYDLHHGSGLFSRRDLVADAAGIAIGIAVILL